MDDMLRDIRMAIRALRSWGPGAVMATVTLAVGIGATTSLYAILRTALAGSVTQIEDVSRLGRLYASNPAAGLDRALITAGDFDGVLTHTQSFESIAAWTRTGMTVGSGAGAGTLFVTSVSPGYFNVLKARPAAGRLFGAAEFDEAAPVALVSDVVWRQRLAGRPVESGLDITLDGVARRVIGIVPATYEFPLIGIGGDAWIPMTGRERRATASVFVIARLEPGHTWASASAELSALTPAARRDASSRFRAIPVEQDSRYRTIAGTTATLMPALVVLIIACVNVACMLLARGLQRDVDLSVRAALGASRGALLRQLLIENLLLASCGGLAGAAVAAGILRLATSFAAIKPAAAAKLPADLSLLPIAIASAALACLLFGTIPALRLSHRDVSASLKGVTPPSRIRAAGYGARDLVVFMELGLATVLVVVTAMWFSLFSALQHVAVSFDADDVIAVRVASRDVSSVSERVSALPGVDRIASASAPPGAFQSSPARVRTEGGRALTPNVMGVDEAFFATTGLAIVRGRGFDRTEAVAKARVAVVSESAAKTLWRDADPIGQELEVSAQGGAEKVTIIGISRDAAGYAALGLGQGDLYRPLDTADQREVALLVRAHHARAMLGSIAAAARSSPAVPMPRAAVLRDTIVRLHDDTVGIIRLIGGLALIALLLAGSGVFGVISQSVAQRRAEFGVRLALGASPFQVLRMVLTREGKLIAAALTAGAIGTIALTNSLFAELVSVSARNPEWPIALIALCGAVAAIGCVLATYRIARLDPSMVLRQN